MNRELLKQAIDLLLKPYSNKAESDKACDLMSKIQKELEKPEPEPFAWFDDETADVWIDPVRPDKGGYEIPLYTSLQQQKPLTPQEWWNLAPWQDMDSAPIEKIILIKRANGNVLRAEYQLGRWAVISPIDGSVVGVSQAIAWLPLPEIK